MKHQHNLYYNQLEKQSEVRREVETNMELPRERQLHEELYINNINRPQQKKNDKLILLGIVKPKPCRNDFEN